MTKTVSSIERAPASISVGMACVEEPILFFKIFLFTMNL